MFTLLIMCAVVRYRPLLALSNLPLLMVATDSGDSV